MRVLPVAAAALLCVGAEPSAVAVPGTAKPEVDRIVRIDDLTEASGLAASLTHDGILWSHNDSGDTARLFAINRKGGAAAVVRLRDTGSTDAEAMARLEVPRDGSGADPVLILADIGDNEAVRDGSDRAAGAARALPQLIVVPEPKKLQNQQATPTLRIRYSYPDGPGDAETLLADPRTQRLYVVSKALFGGRLYAVPPQVWPGADGKVARAAARPGAPRRTVTTELVPMASIPMPLATDGAIQADGAIVVRGYGSLSIFPPAEELSDGAARAVASLGLPSQQQGEGLALDPDHVGSVLINSEGVDQPIYRVALPRVKGKADPTAAAAPTPSEQAAAGAASGESSDRLSTVQVVLGVISLGVIGYAGLSATRALRRRRWSGSRHVR